MAMLDCEQLLADQLPMIRAIAPELGEAYLLDRRPDWPTPPDELGHYVSMRDPQIVRWLIDAGRWKGPRPTIVLDLLRIWLVHCYCNNARFLSYLPAIVIHETAHALPARAFEEQPEPTHALANEHAAKLTEALKQPDSPNMPPRVLHDQRFLRTCGHLAYRARMAGYAFDVSDVVDHRLYGYSPFLAYVAALGDEPALMSAATFTEIENTPAPAAFTELWEQDQ